MKLGVYISTETLCRDTIDMCHVLRKVIPEFDIVVPLPRGGFTPASIIACYFGKPMATPDMLLRHKWWWTTSIEVENARDLGKDLYESDMPKFDNLTLLLVDDVSYNWFGLLYRTKKMLFDNFAQLGVKNLVIYKAPVYCFERTKRNLDFYCKEIALEHYFEKDLMIRKRGSAPMLVDMDGLLCDNTPSEKAYDDTLYLQALVDTKPYLIPQWKIDFILTGRLEKYRKETEEWLQRYGVKYNKLIMAQGDERVHFNHAEYKANTIISLRLPEGSIMLESNLQEAIEIYQRTGMQVICTDTHQLIGAEDIGFSYHPAFEGYKRNEEHPTIVMPKIENQEPVVKLFPWIYEKH